MDFSAVVSRATQLLAESTFGNAYDGELIHPTGSKEGEGTVAPTEIIYGRVCTTKGGEPPIMLSSDVDRKSVFLFGPDAVESIVVKQSGYGILCSIGRDRDYLHHIVVEQKSTFWLILFTPDAPQDSGHLPIAPATWDGIVKHIEATFPKALDDLLTHLQTLKERRLEDFEDEAGFRFLEAKKNRYNDGGSPQYFSYEYFCSLPKPRSAWQVRAFLFCELRLLKLFTGDGYTCNEGANGKRILEYLGPNVRISDLDPAKCTVLRMSVQFPDLIVKCHS